MKEFTRRFDQSGGLLIAGIDCLNLTLNLGFRCGTRAEPSKVNNLQSQLTNPLDPDVKVGAPYFEQSGQQHQQHWAARIFSYCHFSLNLKDIVED